VTYGVRLILAIFVVASCSTAPSPTLPSSAEPGFTLIIRNVDGPRDVGVNINGQDVAHVACGTTAALGAAGLPGLPWDVQMTSSDGSFQKHFIIPSGSPDLSATIRGQDVLLAAPGSPAGPPPLNTPCM
jgi:hypothetical protein